MKHRSITRRVASAFSGDIPSISVQYLRSVFITSWISRLARRSVSNSSSCTSTPPMDLRGARGGSAIIVNLSLVRGWAGPDRTGIFRGDQFTNQISGAICVQTGRSEFFKNPSLGLVCWSSMIETHVPAVQEVLERPGYFWNQNVGHIILVGVHVPKGILHEPYIVGVGHAPVFGLGHEILRVRSAFQIEFDDPALLGHLTGCHYDSILVPNWELKMSGARLKEVVDPDETLVVPIGLGIVLYEIKVHAVG